jgi:superfamily II DNA or RNA helicase
MPKLDVIINCVGNKSDIKTIQMLGRVLRTLDGKTDAHFYDFVDESRFFRLASYARIKALKDEGHDIKRESLNIS